MNSDIIGAIIAAVATIVAAVITVILTRRNRRGATSGEDIDHLPDNGVDDTNQSDGATDANRHPEEIPLDDIPYPAPLPHGSRMVYGSSPLFVGRSSKLKKLAQIIRSDSNAGQAMTVAVTGVGGVGKTQLASEFVHRNGRYFSGGVFWISFADANSVPTEVASCGNVGDSELGSDFDTGGP